ncbi:MAG: phosphoenolpyruvate--protein phosphotransferase [Lachnospiraceae bacterium]|nr:phosphoenolpyruvate--protein phosphotransferase [Lachnospiraceae bacterium]
MLELKGIAASGGIAVASVLRIHGQKAVKGFGGDAGEARKLYFELKKQAHKEFERLAGISRETGNGDMSGLFDSYRMMIEDPNFEEAVLGRINRGVALSDAIRESGEEMAASLVASGDEYIKARSADVMGISDELIHQLSELNEPETGEEPKEDILGTGPYVVIAVRLSPTQLLRLDKRKIEAICLSEGTVNDHTAILAGSMGIPCVVGLGPGLMKEGTERIAVDGTAGMVYLDPDNETVRKYLDVKESIRLRRERARLRLKDRPVTDCGRTVKVCCNISSPDDIDDITANDADGVGLFRTEYLYLKGNDYPSEEEQFESYSEVLRKMKGKEVIIRTCDIGFDKAVDYMKLPVEQNPGMGIRGIRISFERPEMFKTQLRALYRASVFGDLKIMFPMISSIWEIREAKRYCEEVRSELDLEGKEYGDVKIGIMIETPSSALLSGEFAKEVDFFSIGSNDLTQYTIGADRINPDISRYYDAYHPAVKELIRMTVENAHKCGIKVGICGELASDENMTGFFKEICIDELSVSPSRLLRVKLDLLGD